MTAPAVTRMPIADSRSVVREIRGALVGQGTRLVAVVATMILGAALGLVAPWVLGRMVDAVIDGADVGEIWQLGAVMGVAALGFAGFTALGVVLSSRLFETVLARLRERMFRASLALPLERVEVSGTGDLVSRATDDVEEVSTAINTAVPALSTSLFTVVLTAVGLTALDWRFLGALVLIVPVYALAVRWYLRNAPGIYAAERAAMGQRAQHVLGAVRGLRTVHAYDMSPLLAARVGQHSWEVVRGTMRARIDRSASRIPVRVGLTPTSSSTTSLPGTRSAAAIGNAAPEMSPGTCHSKPSQRGSQPSGSSTTIGPIASIGTPSALSIRSV